MPKPCTAATCALFACLALPLLPACSGGGGAETGSQPPPLVTGDNVLPIAVGAGPPGTSVVNVPYVDVTVCVPGTTTCQTIDHVLLDTGSTGLRIVRSVLNAGLNLPAQTADNGDSLAECAVFADSYTWGAVRIADVRLANRVAVSLPVHVIGDPAVPSSVPASCSSQGPREKGTVADFGAKGILGVGHFVEDCGPACVSSPFDGAYYTCPAGVCGPVAVSADKQVQNPVARLPIDNNGVVVSLPAVPASGAVSVSGALILGIGTQGNNALGSAVVFDLDSGANLVTTMGVTSYVAFLDTGSNGLFFDDGAVILCSRFTLAPGFYCPSSTRGFSAVIQAATNGNVANINFTVANADSLVRASPSANAFRNLAGPFGVNGFFDWGLPFFFGRTVFTAIEQRATPGGPGPFVAF
jgi:hypothetical protein